MAISLRCTRIERTAVGGVSVSFDDGSGKEFGSLEEVQSYAYGVDEGPEGVDLAQRVLLARWLRTDPDGSDTAAILNKTCTINAGAVQPVQIG